MLAHALVCFAVLKILLALTYVLKSFDNEHSKDLAKNFKCQINIRLQRLKLQNVVLKLHFKIS